VQRSVHYWPVTAAFVPLPLMQELAGGLGLVTLAQRVRRASAGLELDGFLQQARDALHLEFDCAGGDAPLVFAAHGVIYRMPECGRRWHLRRITVVVRRWEFWCCWGIFGLLRSTFVVRSIVLTADRPSP
jgi:hypothetical protein